MNNREWLNGLSDKEIAEFISSFGEECVCCPLDKTCDGACVARITKWLSEPHETTGHEDLVKMGFSIKESTQLYLTYSDNFGRTLEITKQDIRFKTCSDTIRIWNNRAIDETRKCADKIRKEKGWA